MASINVLVIAIAGGLVAAGVLTLIRKALRATMPSATTLDAVAPNDARTVQLMFRAEARASTVAAAVTVSVAAMMFVFGHFWASGHGLPYALAATVAALAGVLTLGLYPRPEWPTSRRGVTAAELVPRGATSFAARWVFVLPLISSLALLAGLGFAGLYSATDEKGLHRVFQYRSLSGWGVEGGQIVDVQYNLSTAGPYPGWYYGIPIMIGTLSLIGIVYWSLQRAARAPRPAATGLFAIDNELRTLRTRLVMSASTALLGFQVSGLAAITGNIFRSANLETVPRTDMNTAQATVPLEP